MVSAFPILDNVPVGFRFRPTDEELVDYYLKHKLLGKDFMVNNVIAEIDVCKYEPWKLPEFSVIKSDDPEWFFLCPRDYKYAKSKRFNRATKGGFWKATGNDRNIKESGTNNIIGSKKTLVFYKGRLPGVKTNWVIHEYHAVTFGESERTFVLSRLMKKAEKRTEVGTDTLIYDEGGPSRHIGSDYENEATYISGTLPEMNIESIFKANYQGDNYFSSSTQQSPIGIEQEASFPNSPSANAYFGSNMETPFDNTEEEDEFINSMLISEDYVINENRGHAFVNDPTQSKSLRRVYYESSDTDAEVVSELAKKELLMVRSGKNQNKAQNESSRENLETRRHHSSNVNRKFSFICMETPSSSQRLFPRSVYLVNVVIGILLLIIISWDVLFC